MKAIITFFLAFFMWVSSAFALDGWRGFSEKTPPTDEERVDKILAMKKIRKKEHEKLAELCVKNPSLCLEKNLFNKVKQKYFVVDDKSFTQALLAHINDHQDFQTLLMEALDEEDFDPHQSWDHTDLALEILLSKKGILKKKLITMPKFDPNRRYGNKGLFLTSLLAQEKKYSSLKLVMLHPSFDANLVETSGYKAGYYLLKNRKTKDAYLLRQIIRNTLPWNTRGLGLDDPRQLKFFLEKVFDNNEDRLKILKDIILQNLIPIENVGPSEKILGALIQLLTLDDEPIDSAKKIRIGLDQPFTDYAIQMLIDFEILTKPRGHLNIIDGWFSSNVNNLASFKISHINLAQTKHRKKNAISECSICWSNEEEVWFSATSFCEHAFCKDCWQIYCNDLGEEGNACHLKCLEKNCPYMLPPSLFCALAAESLRDEKKFKSIAKAYKNCSLIHTARRENAFRDIEGFRRCPHPKCQEKLIINTEKKNARLLICPRCKNKILIDPVESDSQDLIDTSELINIGRCSSCKGLVEKIDGCQQIFCHYCKRGTIWEQLSAKKF